MITYKTTYCNDYCQKNYDNDIKKIKLRNIKCTCGSRGNFHIHATYNRYISDGNTENSLCVTRVKCESCNKTHALLPSFIIPYRILLNMVIVGIVKPFIHSGKSASVISTMTGLSVDYVLKIIDFYNTYHKERLASFLATSSTDDMLSYEFITGYFNEYHMFFMQRISPTNHILLSE